MIADAILTLTLGVLVPLTALVAMPIMAFSDRNEKVAVGAIYFSHLLTQIVVVSA